MEKNYKIFVCPFVVVCLGVYLLISWIISAWLFNQAQQFPYVAFFIVVGLPTIMFVCVFFAFAPRITFTKIGIEKRLCGIPLKKYKWKEIRDIKIITTGMGGRWLFFQKAI